MSDLKPKEPVATVWAATLYVRVSAKGWTHDERGARVAILEEAKRRKLDVLHIVGIQDTHNPPEPDGTNGPMKTLTDTIGKDEK